MRGFLLVARFPRKRHANLSLGTAKMGDMDLKPNYRFEISLWTDRLHL